MRWLPSAALALVLASPVAAEPPSVRYSDQELVDGFVRTVFGAENPKQRIFSETRRVKKFVGTVRVAIVNLARQDRRPEVTTFFDTLYRTTSNLKFDHESDADTANFVVFLVDRADYAAVIRRTLPPGQDTAFLERNDCSAVTGGGAGGLLDRAFVYIVVDEGARNFRHCMVEEIIQALGPVNDSDKLSDSIFNDRSQVDDFTVFDWFILNMLYDRRVRVGMSEAEARKVLPAAIADCRRRLARITRSGVFSVR